MTVMGPIADYQTNLNKGPLTASAFAKAFRRLSTNPEHSGWGSSFAELAIVPLEKGRDSSILFAVREAR